jgi:hypothetical protein
LIHTAADLSFLHTDYLWRMAGSWVGTALDFTVRHLVGIWHYAAS